MCCGTYEAGHLTAPDQCFQDQPPLTQPRGIHTCAASSVLSALSLQLLGLDEPMVDFKY